MLSVHWYDKIRQEYLTPSRKRNYHSKRWRGGTQILDGNPRSGMVWILWTGGYDFNCNTITTSVIAIIAIMVNVCASIIYLVLLGYWHFFHNQIDSMHRFDVLIVSIPCLVQWPELPAKYPLAKIQYTDRSIWARWFMHWGVYWHNLTWRFL